MTEYQVESYDVAVIGAGHAGIEAALAAARLGLKTVIFTINLDAVGNMPCNPAIGGTGKGHLVREIDALGGEMGRAADRACIQFRVLNRGKGPAVHSLRAQADRRRYQELMKHTLEQQENLDLKQADDYRDSAERIRQRWSRGDPAGGRLSHPGRGYLHRHLSFQPGHYRRMLLRLRPRRYARCHRSQRQSAGSWTLSPAL